MSRTTFRATASAGNLLLLWCCLGLAQDVASPGQPGGGVAPAAGESQPAARRIEEARPQLFYLEDATGALVPVPNITFEDFALAQEVLYGGVDRRPPYVFEELTAEGTADARFAELTIQATVVLTRQDQWVRVPLGLDRSLMREPAEYEGAGEGFVLFEDDGGGYVVWIRGPAKKEHRLRLKVLVPLVVAGEETRLELLTPRATMSGLRLTVPIPNAVAEVSRGVLLATSSAADGQTTEFQVQGLGGNFELSWHGPSPLSSQQRSVLEVETSVLARIGPQWVDSEATLSVESSGAPLSSFVVRLPPGASLLSGVSTGSAGYSAAAVESGDGLPPQPGLVEIRLAEKTSEPVRISLLTRQPYLPGQPAGWLELAGFEVVGAARQWGHIDVAADPAWQIRWGSSRGVRQVEPLSFEEEVVAGFDYNAQPYSLTARLVPQRTRISVEPEYRLLVDARRVRLEARLQYTIRGAKTYKLDVVLPQGWDLISVEPENLVAVDGITLGEGNVRSIPLLKPLTGPMDLLLTAQWSIPEDSSSFAVALPQPQADWPGPASVEVVAADNIELTPDTNLMAGLVRQPPPELPYRQQQQRLYYQAEAPEAVFAADFRVHSRRVAAEVTSRISLTDWGGQVQQTLAYTIDYEPADSLAVSVPRDLAQSDQLQFFYDGQPLLPAVPPGDAGGQSGSAPVLLQVPLPWSCIGGCELEVRYPLRLADLAGVSQLVQHEPVEVPLPLVMPAEGSLSGNRLFVEAPPEIKVRLSDETQASWEQEAPQPGSSPGLRFSTEQSTSEVRLEIELDRQQGMTSVERAWVQTWLIPSGRRDRALFSFTSDQKELTVVVPAGAATDRVQVLLDGQPVAGKIDAERRLVIPLSEEMNQGRHLLDLRTAFPPGQRHPARLAIELPRLADDARADWSYWEVVLPSDEHLVATPKGLIGEFAWKWDGLCWGRQPLLDQSRLARWVGLPVDDVPEESLLRGANCYLLSSMGSLRRSELLIAERSWIVLCASGAALLAGLLLIHFRPARHPASLLVAAIALLGVGMVYPEPALLLGQAASLGLALALAAAVLRLSAAWRRGAALPPESPSAILESASTETHYPVPPAAAQASTQAAPASVAPPTADSSE